jgi:hypothetical protein
MTAIQYNLYAGRKITMRVVCGTCYTKNYKYLLGMIRSSIFLLAHYSPIGYSYNTTF